MKLELANGSAWMQGNPICSSKLYGRNLSKKWNGRLSNSLSDADVEAIQQYLLKRQSDLYNQKKN